ncbi:hypothetical protein DL770_006159 [Monosporascus sp. CRB-9-2]|nr:hypothetical protein DL770_006159 [Monosporascus sp. CRB-9-2]
MSRLFRIYETASNKANLVVFPETYIPAFPIWDSVRPPTHNHEFFKHTTLESICQKVPSTLARDTIYVDGEEAGAIRAAAKQLGILVSIGISAKVHTSSATLFNSNVIIGSDGDILVHHKKPMPTFFEKLTWVPGGGYGLRVAETRFGEELHVSTWPEVWPTRISTSAGANYDNIATNHTREAGHCFEAKYFGILCSGFLDADAIELAAFGYDDEYFITRGLEQS